jgi:PAS domain S-box-containing protein
MDCAETRRIFRIFSLAVALGLMTSMAGAEINARPRSIRVVMDGDYAPYAFRSEDGRLQGILIDQWHAWEKKTGIKAELHGMDWSQALRRMRAGEFDVIDCIVETEDRRRYFDFTPPYAAVEASIFFRHDISGISDLPSLKGFPVGVKAGDQHIDKLRENGVTTVIPFQNFREIISAAKQHKVDVFVADVPAALYLSNKAGIAAEFRRSAPLFRDDLRRAVLKGNAQALSIVSDGFSQIEPDELKRIDDAWLGLSINNYGRYFGYAGYASVVALLIIATLFGWNRVLSRRIMLHTAALGESEQRLRQIAENIREVFWLTTIDSGELLYVSPAYESVWGRPRQELNQAPRSFSAAIHPEDRSRAAVAPESDGEHGFEVEYRIVRPDGSIRWIRDRGFPIQDDAARVYRLAGIAEDITERKSAAEAVKEAEDRVRLIIDTIPAMVWRMRADGAADFVNRRWLDHTGVPYTDAIEAPNIIVHPDDLPRVMERWLVDMVEGRASEDEMRLRRADGTYQWFLVRTVPLRDRDGNVINWYGTSTDIEGRKLAEEKLRRSESQLADAQRIAHFGSWDLDLRSGAVTCSEELYRIFDTHPGKTDFRRHSLSLIHPEDRELMGNALDRLLKNYSPYDFYYRIIRQDGERILHSVAHLVIDEDGTPLKLLGSTQDVTEIKRAEEKLKTTTEQLRALSARVQSAREEEGIRIAREIHDELGATLTSLRWDLEAVKKNAADPAAVLPGGDLKDRISGMLDLTDTMINMVRRIASDLRPAVLDVLGLEEAIEWQAQQFQDRTGIEVHCESGDGIDLNPEQSTAVFRIFQEALTNVLRHARATRVDVTAVEDTGAFVLMIGDNGRGITDSERIDDLSIGLLGMRERAHLIGGEIDVTGVVGEGTTVTLRLPVASG